MFGYATHPISEKLSSGITLSSSIAPLRAVAFLCRLANQLQASLTRKGAAATGATGSRSLPGPSARHPTPSSASMGSTVPANS
jgi:hypothetical protein